MSFTRSVFIILIVVIFSVPAFSKWSEPVPVTIANDSSAEDWSPFLTTDGLTLYFARVRSSSSYYGKICAATRNDIDEPFSSVRVLDCPLNRSSGHQLCPWVSCDNLRMYYHNENGRYRIMLSERKTIDASWPAGKSVDELNLLGDKLQAPSLTQDELIIVFDAYNVKGGKGGYDLWIATRPDRHSSFSFFRNLSELNSEFNENGTSISPDGLEIYFDSNRNGHHQIFKATRKTLNESFSNIVVMSEFEIPGISNSHPSISYNGKVLYLRRESISDRSKRDIYMSYYSGNNNSDIGEISIEYLYEIVEKNHESE